MDKSFQQTGASSLPSIVFGCLCRITRCSRARGLILHPFVHVIFPNRDTTQVGTSHEAIHIFCTYAEFASVLHKSHRETRTSDVRLSRARPARLVSNTEMYLESFCCVRIAVNTQALQKDKEYLRFLCCFRLLAQSSDPQVFHTQVFPNPSDIYLKKSSPILKCFSNPFDADLYLQKPSSVRIFP